MVKYINDTLGVGRGRGTLFVVARLSGCLSVCLRLSHSNRFAGRNLALGRPSEQSSTLWNYNSELATDRDPDTCSFTPKSSGQRWWQVDLEHEYTVQAVAVTIAQDSYQHFTLFVIGT